jgi:hypothetical protein
MATRWIAAGLTAFAFLGGSARAGAALAEGDVSPSFVGKEFIHTSAFAQKELRGRLILYEIFSTG